MSAASIVIEVVPRPLNVAVKLEFPPVTVSPPWKVPTAPATLH